MIINPTIQTVLIDCWKFIEELPDKSVSTIITDPMYDDKTLSAKLPELERVCAGNIIMFCSPENPFFTPDEIAYWLKTPSTKNYSKRLGRFVEWILIRRRGNVFNAGLHWSNYTGIYNDILSEKTSHPFQKPVPLLERLIKIYTRSGDTILDPFAGSGTTLVAARNTGRHAIGCEINPEHYKILEKKVKEFPP